MKPWIVYVATYPPRECGIATFTQDLIGAVDELYNQALESKVVAMNARGAPLFKYPPKVLWQIRENEREDYVRVAKALNENQQVKMVNIQHEFGIFGGGYGSYILNFVDALQKPLVVTFHTVLPTSNKSLHITVQAVARAAKKIIVMTDLSKKILIDDYSIPPSKIKIIPHGIPPVSYQEPVRAKKDLRLSERTVLLTFGLLNRNKGIQYILDALPSVVKKFPNILYLIVGATHPVVLQEEGESYRNELVKKIRKLGLGGNVRFYNRYLELPELIKFLQATDIYLSPSLDPDQAVSGTLSYALGLGRPVVSTPFAQAREELSEREGLLVKFRNPNSISEALLKLLADDTGRIAMGKSAYFHTRNKTWPNVGLAYAREFASYIPELRNQEKNLPPFKLNHLIKLTDNFGIIQFAKLTEPEYSSGYTVDDNARALIVAAEYYEQHPREYVSRLMQKYLAFLKFTLQRDGSFANYVNADRSMNAKQNEKEDPEDPSARALLALAVVADSSATPSFIRGRAANLFVSSFDANGGFSFPRPAAHFIKALGIFLRGRANSKSAFRKKQALIHYANFLCDSFEKSSSRRWQWFETKLTYCNGILPEALFWAYEVTKKERYLDIGKRSMNFLIEKTFRNGTYLPIGQNGWYRRAGKRTYFDQQPEDASATVQMLRKIYEITGDNHYKRLMYQAFSWFLGDNLLRLAVYDRSTGGCYDGVGEKEVNLNQGAESTVSYLLARLAFERKS